MYTAQVIFKQYVSVTTTANSEVPSTDFTDLYPGVKSTNGTRYFNRYAVKIWSAYLD